MRTRYDAAFWARTALKLISGVDGRTPAIELALGELRLGTRVVDRGTQRLQHCTRCTTSNRRR